jgi:hypothetical protein
MSMFGSNYSNSATMMTATLVSKRPEGVRVGDVLDELKKMGAHAQMMGLDWEGRVRSVYHWHDHEGKWKLSQEAKGKTGIEVQRELEDEVEETGDDRSDQDIYSTLSTASESSNSES